MSSTSASPTTSSSTSAAVSSSAAATLKAPGNLKIVGIILAITSGVLIGSSFVFKKKGLLRSQAAAGEGVAYLKSALWWSGMIMMILGELCNFAAYAFVEAIVVTPMGALSVVICAVLSHFFLNETLSFFGWLGCGLCVVGSVIIALNGPQEESIGQITEFQKLFLSPGFLVYGSVLIAASLVIIFYFAPRYGKKSMLWYIMVCSMIGGISVSVTTGLGSAIVTTAMGDSQFKHWFIYFLMVFIAVTLITEVYYLNVALALFNTAMVTPTYYVIFTFFSIMTTIVLFKGLKASATSIITLVMGFIVICFGITILQLSKVDPTQLKQLDRRSTILLQAAKRNTEDMDEKSLTAVEDPGIDALRGSFGTLGSIVRAKSAKRMSMSSARAPSSIRSRVNRDSDWEHPLPPIPQHLSGVSGISGISSFSNTAGQYPGMKRHQLYDPPVIRDEDSLSMASRPSQMGSPRKQTIKFGEQDLVHSYHMPGTGDNTATHEPRSAFRLAQFPSTPYSPLEDAVPQTLTPPPMIPDEENGLRSAPPEIDTNNTHHRRLSIDPFAIPPATTTLATFPSVSSISSATTPGETPTSSRRLISPLKGDKAGSPPPQHHHLFGLPSLGSPRKYPKGDKEEDREESESLWHGVSEDGDRRSDDVELGNSIRLVPSSNNRI